MVKKLSLCILAFVFTSSCSHSVKPTKELSGHCFQLHFEAREAAALNNDKEMLIKLDDDMLCTGDYYKIESDVAMLKEYLEAAKKYD